jgi:hypothetical protein
MMPRRASPRPPWRVAPAWRGSSEFERCAHDADHSPEVCRLSPASPCSPGWGRGGWGGRDVPTRVDPGAEPGRKHNERGVLHNLLRCAKCLCQGIAIHPGAPQPGSGPVEQAAALWVPPRCLHRRRWHGHDAAPPLSPIRRDAGVPRAGTRAYALTCRGHVYMDADVLGCRGTLCPFGQAACHDPAGCGASHSAGLPIGPFRSFAKLFALYA